MEKDKLRDAAGPAPASAALPEFDYFVPSALSAVVEMTDEVCDCCGHRRGHLYTGPFYHPGPRPGPDICLHCIKNGTAAQKYDGSFNDIVVEFDGEVIDKQAAKAPDEIIDQLLHRTPGYETWQGNQWIFHCGDGGVFQGDATADSVTNASAEAKAHFDVINEYNSFDEIFADWTPQGRPSVYHFKCRKCAMDLFLWDMS